VQLKSGDVLYFPPTGTQVAVLGSVHTQAIYELRSDESIVSVLEMAGGKTSTAAETRATLERIDETGSRHAFTITLNYDGLATRLKNGDILRVEAIVSNFTESVTLRGSVASPGHYRWHAGMHLSELMPEREALETREYWWHRTELGLPAPEFVESVEQLSSINQPLTSPKVLDSFQNSSAFASTSTIAGSPNIADLHKNAQTGSISSSNSERMEEHALVQQARSQTNWNYAVIERLDLKTMRTFLIPFDPGHLVLNHDATQDYELEQGDVVTIFSQDDLNLPTMQQTRYVRLEGEFVHAGIYSVAPGETLRSLAQRAGGLTPNAYLYGSEFTRNSTRILEQQRLDEYTARIEQEMHHNTLAAAGQMTMGGANNNASEAASLNRDVLDRMRQMKASGRIVLNMRPQSIGIDALPELPLEDGDRLVVPAQPATVQVVGAVMNQNAFLYRPDAHLSDYLRDAGGPSRQADKSRTFILRADGSVTSSTNGKSIFASSAIGSQKLNPGDTIIVPEKLWRPSAMNEVMTWVQLFTSLSLSAAAINSIK
jgi:protein involved in polysaccharide export with SLBB domain